MAQQGLSGLIKKKRHCRLYCCIISVPGDRDMFASKEGEASKYSGKKEDSRIRLGEKLFRKNGFFFTPPKSHD